MPITTEKKRMNTDSKDASNSRQNISNSRVDNSRRENKNVTIYGCQQQQGDTNNSVGGGGGQGKGQMEGYIQYIYYSTFFTYFSAV
jgi:hypothetical protein